MTWTDWGRISVKISTTAHQVARDPQSPPLLSLFIVVGVGIVAGIIAEGYNIPAMLGMLIAGLLLRNVLPTVIVPIPHSWTSRLWTMALASVVARAGLSLKKDQVLKYFTMTLYIGAIPVLVEALFLGLMTRFAFQIPFSWAMTMAFGVASISPGVVGPLLLQLKDDPLWKGSRVLTIMLTSLGFDVLIATTGFGVALAASLGQDQDSNSWILRCIEDVGLGSIFGVFIGSMGTLMSSIKLDESLMTGILFLSNSLVMIVAKTNGFVGAASCSTIISWAIVANTWAPSDVAEADLKLKQIWNVFKPCLFPVIGASIAFSEMSRSMFFTCLGLVALSVCVKMGVAYLSGRAAGLNPQESLFVCGLWTGKASVQATLCGVALEMVHHYDLMALESNAKIVFTGMVCAIMIGIPFASTWARLHPIPPSIEKSDSLDHL